MCTLIRQDVRTARKDHECELCGWFIRKGSRYVAQVQSDEGTIYTFKMHEICNKKSDEHFEEYNDWELNAFDFRKEILGVDPDSDEMPEVK